MQHFALQPYVVINRLHSTVVFDPTVGVMESHHPADYVNTAAPSVVPPLSVVRKGNADTGQIVAALRAQLRSAPAKTAQSLVDQLLDCVGNGFSGDNDGSLPALSDAAQKKTYDAWLADTAFRAMRVHAWRSSKLCLERLQTVLGRNAQKQRLAGLHLLRAYIESQVVGLSDEELKESFPAILDDRSGPDVSPEMEKAVRDAFQAEAEFTQQRVDALVRHGARALIQQCQRALRAQSESLQRRDDSLAC